MKFVAKIAAYMRKHALIAPGDRVGVAVSGGADSVALLRALVELRGELGCVLAVVHFNHRIRPEADADAAFVESLARGFGLEFFIGVGDAKKFASQHRVSLETAARELRYGFFSQVTSGAKAPIQKQAVTARLKPRPYERYSIEVGAGSRSKRLKPRPYEGNSPRAGTFEVAASHPLDKIATAHTLDDQAETVLMKVLRGAGTRGLSGIWPCIRRQEAGGRRQENRTAEDGCATQIIRPMLGVRRKEVEAYLRMLGQEWREDASNRDVKHTRNKVRHELLPLLEAEYNPNIHQQLADAAEVARAEEEFWNQYPVLSTQYSEKANAGPSARSPRRPSLGMTSVGRDGRQKELQPLAGISKGCTHEDVRTYIDLRGSETRHAASLREGVSLRLDLLADEPLAVRRRTVRAVFKRVSGKSLDFEHTDALVRFLERRESSRLQLPERWFAVLDWPRRALRFEERAPVRMAGTGVGRKTSKKQGAGSRR